MLCDTLPAANVFRCVEDVEDVEEVPAWREDEEVPACVEDEEETWARTSTNRPGRGRFGL
jgi:hypothetical protein